MKHIYIIISLFFLVGCERDPMLSNELVAVRLIASMDDHTTGTTRVDNATWYFWDEVGVSTGADYIEYKTNLTADGTQSAPSVTLTPKNASTVYYPSDGSPLTFRAFCPYVVPDGNDDDELTYNFTNQSSLLESKDVDLVYAVATGSRTSPTVNLIFKHQFCKVIFEIERGEGISDDMRNNLQRKTSMRGIPTSATFNLSTKALKVSDPGEIKRFFPLEIDWEGEDIKLKSDGTEAMIAAIVPPHKGKGSGAEVEGKDFFPGRTIDFTLEASGINYSYPIPDGFDFEAGKVYTFKFTLTRTAPILTIIYTNQWNSGAMAWDVNKKHFLTAPAEVLHYNEATKGNTIVIKTNHPDGENIPPSIAYSTSETEITGSLSDWLEGVLPVAKTLDISPFEWTFTYNVTQKNTDTTDRVGYIHTTVGNMTVVTKVTQSKDAEVIPMGTLLDGNTNCFMVPPGTVITFPLSRLFDPLIQGKSVDPTLQGLLPAPVAKPTSTFKVEKLWDDAEGRAVSGVWVGGVGENAYVTVETGLFPGNALIAVRDREQDNVIVWSYHIWVTDYVPIASATFTNIWNTNNGGQHYVFMDRNLGATTGGLYAALAPESDNPTGLYYQWGRKDPFPARGLPGAIQEGGGRFTAVASDATTGTVPYTIQHPHVFLTFVEGSWLRSGNSIALWGGIPAGATGITKTIYDPCPIGWRVPKHQGSNTTPGASPWYGFSASSAASQDSATPQHLNPSGFMKGYQWGENAAYPASGFRAASDGKTAGAGGMGYYWSATQRAAASSANVLSIDSREVYVSNSDYKAKGNSVRCVQE